MPNNPITTLPLDRLALHLAANHVPNAAHILQQEEGRRRMANKVPLWAQTPGIEYPPRLALEQCSGQPAAQYKARLVEQLLPDPAQRQHLVDLTGGLGVDFSFMAPHFAHATYVEQQPQLETGYRGNGLKTDRLLGIVLELAIQRRGQCKRIVITVVVITVKNRVDFLERAALNVLVTVTILE